MILYIIRHGETDFNKFGIVQGSGVDTDLNEKGHEQAHAFFQYYKQVEFDLVVTSKLKRTHQTVQHFIDKGLPWIQTPDINEISWGVHEGQSNTPERLEEYRSTISSWENGDLEASIPGGENARALGQRLAGFIDWLHTRPANRMLVCTHGRTMRALITLIKGLPLQHMEAISHQNTGCFIVRWQEGRFVVEAENNADHLEHLLLS